jgi:hypothetical protein
MPRDMSRSQAVGRSRPPQRSGGLQPTPSPPAATTSRWASRHGALDPLPCRRVAVPIAEPLERSAGLRARTLVARSIENAGTADSVVYILPRESVHSHATSTRSWTASDTDTAFPPDCGERARWLQYRRNETRCGTREGTASASQLCGRMSAILVVFLRSFTVFLRYIAGLEPRAFG